MRRVERSIDAKGEHLLVPRIGPEGWATRLSRDGFDAQTVIALYADHGMHEQSHAEFKTDLDLEQLPSGKFDTNHFVCQPAAPAMLPHGELRPIPPVSGHRPGNPLNEPAGRRSSKSI